MTDATDNRAAIGHEAWLRQNLPHLHVGPGTQNRIHIIGAQQCWPLCQRDIFILEEGALDTFKQPLCKTCASRQGDIYADW